MLDQGIQSMGLCEPGLFVAWEVEIIDREGGRGEGAWWRRKSMGKSLGLQQR
jgi:hypothetical protein